MNRDELIRIEAFKLAIDAYEKFGAPHEILEKENWPNSPELWIDIWMDWFEERIDNASV